MQCEQKRLTAGNPTGHPKIQEATLSCRCFPSSTGQTLTTTNYSIFLLHRPGQTLFYHGPHFDSRQLLDLHPRGMPLVVSRQIAGTIARLFS